MPGLDFITANPADTSYDTQMARQVKLAKTQQDIGVDQAVRDGVGDMLQQKQPTQPDPTISYTVPSAAPPGAAPSSGAAGTPFAQGLATSESSGNAGTVNSLGYSGKYQMGKAALQDAGIYQPSAGESISDNHNWNGTFNVPGKGAMGYSQWLGDPSAQDASFNAHVAHMDTKIGTGGQGMSGYIGQVIGGVPITQDSLRGMIHLGGAMGTQRFLASGGQYDPSDGRTKISDYGRKFANISAPPGVAPAPASYAGAVPGLGQQLAGDYAAANPAPAVPPGAAASPAPTQVASAALPESPIPPAEGAPPLPGDQQQAAAAPAAGANFLQAPIDPNTVTMPTTAYAVPGSGGQSFMPGAGGGMGTRFDPILNRLATTPGGGAAALNLLNQQGRFDQANYRRADSATRMVMLSLARGDTATARGINDAYGLNLPQGMFQDNSNTKRVAQLGLIAKDLYANDPNAAHTFIQTALQTGDAQAAIQAAGPSAGKTPQQTMVMVQQGANTYGYTFNHATGTATPTLDQNGNQITGNKPASTAGQNHVTWVTSPDGKTQTAYHPDSTGNFSPMLDGTGAQISQPVRAPGGARVADREVRLRMLKAAGFGDADSNAIAAGATVSPNAMVNAYTRLSSVMQSDTTLEPAEKSDRLNQVMTTAFGPNWRQTMQQHTVGGAQLPPTQVAPINNAVPAAPAAPAAPYQVPQPVPTAAAAAPPPAATPNTPPAAAAAAPPPPTAAVVQQAQQAAREAIANNKNRELVLRKLQKYGIPIPADLAGP